ncbi:hypothetical protein [Agrococcus jejuensis]|uniref:SPW repeat-containing protein n=1 Tax=Agrococcus jejuensis TaxID=399736 RepID=A0A1G8C4T7_9MICO|nr:hypothetical protein [Agrococcus jejuensis]SDH40511.1 hypothetical protein SAMN04489720_1168 [Agrococcus jejuensis]
MPKPSTVRWGVTILWIGLALTVAVAVVGAAAAGVAVDPAFTFLVLGIAGIVCLLQAGLLLAAGNGYGWARVVLTVVTVLGVAPGLLSGEGLNLGSVVAVVAVVLLCVPSSNAWYADQARLRAQERARPA